MFRRKFERGFTLIEICIGIIIVGLMTAAFVRFADITLKQKRQQDLKIALQDLRDALEDYEKNPQHPYLPCPAPLTAINSDNAFGRSVACNGANHAGTFVVNGRNENGSPLKVRIGALPIRELGISSDMMLDPWYRRITYAVTERNTIAAEAASEGAITVNDGFGHSLTDPAGTVRYVLFSAGQDGAGAYSTEGKPFAPCGGGLDGQNCDRSDATFIAADRTDTSAASHYDDKLVYKVEAAGSAGGITIFGTESQILLTPNTYQNSPDPAWKTVDLSSYVPPGAKAALITSQCRQGEVLFSNEDSTAPLQYMKPVQGVWDDYPLGVMAIARNNTIDLNTSWVKLPASRKIKYGVGLLDGNAGGCQLRLDGYAN